MKLRILTALPLALIVVAIVWWAPMWLFVLALVTTVELGLYEFFTLCRHAGFKPIAEVGYVAGTLACLMQVVELRRPMPGVSVLLVLAVLTVLFLAFRLSSDLKSYLGAVASTTFGLLYIALALSWLVPLRFSSLLGKAMAGPHLILFLFLVIWAGDIAAFLVGRSVGQTFLAPTISPQKTVEGALGGLVGSLLVGWAYGHWFWQTPGAKTTILLSGLVAASGQLGDLVESAMKRGAEVKDSGSILPGHGGLLDRIDSLLFGIPALWLALTLRDLIP